MPKSTVEYDKLLLETIKPLQRTRELSVLWQQTVESLAKALGASRCVLYPYQDSGETLLGAIAEFRQEPILAMLGQELTVADERQLRLAIASKKPVLVHEFPPDDPLGRQSMLVVATRFDDRVNGAIALHQCDRPRQWTAAEISFAREFAEQVGYCIHNATLERDLQAARQEAAVASRLKSQFLGNLNDKLRNPLNGIICSLQLILDDLVEDAEQEREFIHDAHRCAMSLYKTINDLLHFAYLKDGKFDSKMDEPVNLERLLDNVERFTQPTAAHRQLSLKIARPQSDRELILLGNELRLLQVMLNLIGNAIKFTHCGDIHVSAEVIAKKAAASDRSLAGAVEFQITDTGIGVPLQYQPRLFEPFFQVHDPRTSPYPGTGLGLAISQKLVEAMGGQMNFHSMGEEMGATVTFTVPLYEGQP